MNKKRRDRQKQTKKEKVDLKQQQGINEADLLGLTAPRYRLLMVILEPDTMRKRNVTKICQQADICRSTYYDAMKDPSFRKLIRETSKNLIAPHIPQLIEAYVRHAIGGSVKHGDRLLELAGMIEQKDLNVNLNSPLAEIAKVMREKQDAQGDEDIDDSF